jgi:hypothetical protein
MAILKNEPLFSFKEGDYAKPHHIIVSGSDEEIGYELASLAKVKFVIPNNWLQRTALRVAAVIGE